MAGDWIKMRTRIADDPAVISIATSLNLDPDTVVGKLHRLWSWATDQLRDGYARGVTEKWIDAHVGVPEFAVCMAQAGWLEIGSDFVVFPNWDEHLSQGAKCRALTNKRMAEKRIRDSDARSVTEASPEKRREEKSISAAAADGFAEIPPEVAKTITRLLGSRLGEYNAAPPAERLAMLARLGGLDDVWLADHGDATVEKRVALCLALHDRAQLNGRAKNPAAYVAKRFAKHEKGQRR